MKLFSLSTENEISNVHKIKMLENKKKIFETLRCYNYHVNKCYNANNLTFMRMINFMLSWVEHEKVYKETWRTAFLTTRPM